MIKWKGKKMIFTKYVCIYNLDEYNYLMLNTLTSAMDIIDHETKLRIDDMIRGKTEITEENDPELFSSLKTRGYIFCDAEEEFQLLSKMRYINEQLNFRHLNTDFTICPTMGCNLRCTYCFESECQHKDYGLLSDAQLNTIFEHIRKCCNEYISIDTELKKHGKSIGRLPCINLFGGEPLLKTNYDIVRRIIHFAKEINIPVKIITNGTNIESYAELLSEYKDRISIQITMDGNREVHNMRRVRVDGSGTFDDICDGVDKVLEMGIQINLRINIDRDNIEGIGDLKKVFDKKGWTSNKLFVPYASPVQCFGEEGSNILKESEMLSYLLEKGWYGSKNSFIKYIVATATGFVVNFFNSGEGMRMWKTTYCEATSGSNYCFAPDGTISTCLTYVGKGENYIGTFDETGVHINQNNYRLWIDRNPFMMEKCKECKYILMCGGGCPVAALERNKRIDCVVCNDIEDTFKVYIDHIKDRFLSNASK